MDRRNKVITNKVISNRLIGSEKIAGAGGLIEWGVRIIFGGGEFC